ncbi:putative snRNA-activating protein complex, subunit 3 [Rosa chinensis]|uniref:Putative snRNA-activating protein complex, subunit 3 n=1 Tax=Rosa chinensis TaxID=74649 RepID=A0A2P6PR42_ROSCH|nr:putative snRNA-activating protein complex, subunit 3 [Rosa chinensis]
MHFKFYLTALGQFLIESVSLSINQSPPSRVVEVTIDTVVIRDIRLLHPEDIQNRAAYQLLLYQLKLHVQKYKVCQMYSATKLTVNDNWIAENPCYFSDNCYLSM